MIRLPLAELLRRLTTPTHRGLMLWAVVLALSTLSFCVHLQRASVHRGEARAMQSVQMPATKALPRPAHRR